MFHYVAYIYSPLTNIKSNTSIKEKHLYSYKQIKTNEYKFPASDTNKKPDKYFFSLG